MARGKFIPSGKIANDYTELNSLLFENKLPKAEKVFIGFNTGISRTIGRFKYSGGVTWIELSHSRFANKIDDPKVYVGYINTLIHEMVHLYFYHIGANHVKHDKNFFMKLRDCLYTFDYQCGGRIREKCDDEELTKEIKSHLSQYYSNRKAETYKYFFECPHCGFTYKSKRKSDKITKRMVLGLPVYHGCEPSAKDKRLVVFQQVKK